MKDRKIVDNILGVSPSGTGIRIASGITKGFEEGLKIPNPKIEVNISKSINEPPKNPYEFVGRIDGPPLTQFRKR
ncbi:hypothetical protein [Enterococcus gallinarum]|uniref:hypothetical protein n=1 Tax=Enterococcus gallinarum TaxID=1353 RepID=UPI00288C6F49|nr:hypothetical protein [Enterococcus gallinarum]MDT2679836.1 hypothetical protein [Enterococcus gallinarum]